MIFRSISVLLICSWSDCLQMIDWVERTYFLFLGYRKKAKEIVQGALFTESGLDDGLDHAGGVGGLVMIWDLDFFSFCYLFTSIPVQVPCGLCSISATDCWLKQAFSGNWCFCQTTPRSTASLADGVCCALNPWDQKPIGVAVVLYCMHTHFPNLELSFLIDSIHQESTKVSVGVFLLVS